MKTGLSLFEHAVRLVFGNLGQALRISALLYFTPLLLLLLFPFLAGARAVDTDELSGVEFVMLFAFFFVAVFGSLWVAVAWHRFVLLGEMTNGWIPDFNGRRILSYLGKSILLGLLGFAIFFVVGLIAGAVGLFSAPVTAIIMGILIVFVAFMIFYRLGVILPASSVDHSLSLSDAWTRTSGATGEIVVLALVCAVAQFVISLPSSLFQAFLGPLPAMAWEVVAGWITLLVSISVLTTLYGHYVEGRPLNR